MSELRRRITRLEQAGRPEPGLLAEWMRFCRAMNAMHPLFDAQELAAVAKEGAATGETPAQAWVRWMQQAWAETTGAN